MSRITIVPDDGNVLVDGEAREIDMTGIDPAIHAVQWFDTAGEIEYTEADGRRNEQITDISPFQSFIDLWAAAAPDPPTLDDLKVLKIQDFITLGVSRIAVEVPDLDTLDSIKTVAAIWPEISAGARAVLTKAKDIYLYFNDIVPPKVNAMATEAEVDAVDPTLADPFGDGDLWPT